MVGCAIWLLRYHSHLCEHLIWLYISTTIATLHGTITSKIHKLRRFTKIMKINQLQGEKMNHNTQKFGAIATVDNYKQAIPGILDSKLKQ